MIRMNGKEYGNKSAYSFLNAADDGGKMRSFLESLFLDG